MNKGKNGSLGTSLRILLILAVTMLSSCGGGSGGSGGGDASDSAVTMSGSATLNSNTVALSSTQAAEIADTKANPDGTLEVVTTANSSLGAVLKIGSIVLVTAGTDSRFPLGFAGKVVNANTGSDSVTTVTLDSATLADVVQKSSIESNEVALNSTNFVGVIAPSAVRASNMAQPQSISLLKQSVTTLNGGVTLSEPNYVGREINSVVTALGFSDNSIDITLGEIAINVGVKLPEMGIEPSRFSPYGSGDEASIDLIGSIKNLRLIENHQFDTTLNVVSGVKSLDVRLEGDIDLDLGFHGGVEAEIGYFSQAWKEVEEEAFKLLGVSAKLTGLDSKDKIGKFPLLGLVFSVPCPPPSGCPISVGQTQTPLQAAKAGGVIVWISMGFDGKITLDGAIGAQLNAGHLDIGVQKNENEELVPVRELTNNGTERLIEAPYLDGGASAVLRLGPALDIDFFTFGIRIVNAAAFAGTELNAQLDEANTRISYGTNALGDPWSWMTSNELCFQYGIGAGAIFAAKASLGVEIDTQLGDLNGTLEYSGTWPTEEEMVLPGLHAGWYTVGQTRICIPAPVVSEIATTHDASTNTLTIRLNGMFLPSDLQLTVSPEWSCLDIQKVASNKASATYVCQLADSADTVDFTLTSDKANNVDLSTVTDQLSYSLGPWPPKNLSAAEGDKQVTISWDTVPNADFYNVYWSTTPGVNKVTGQKIDNIVDNSYVHTGLENGTNYYYAVTAVNASGESEEGENSGLSATPRSILNDRILILSERDGNWEIYSVGLDGTNQINLTKNKAEDRLPSLSPERGRIAFVTDRDGNNEIYIMTSDGANPTRLTNNNADDVTPVWSPDGNRIAFVSQRDGNYEIYVMDADGNNETRLTNSSADDTFPSWSPDSKWITFVTERDGNQEIYKMSADGMQPAVNLTNDPASDTIPFFSPDGSWISFVSNRDGNYDLWVMDTNGNNLRKITTATNNIVGWYAWSPDGTQIAFDSKADGDYEVYVINADGTNLRQITTNTASDQFATWTWDGKKIVFISNRDGNNQIYTMEPDGTDPVNISNDTSNVALPMASPVYQTGGGCFIATAAYGSYLEPEVMVLRGFRDKYLLTNEAGKTFIKYYYKWSPPIADVIVKHEVLKIFVRASLTPLIYAIKYPVGATNVMLIFIFFLWYAKFYRKGR